MAQRLHSIFDYLRPHTLIEHKGPTDDLSADDAMVLLGYAFQYMVLAGERDPTSLGLMVICDSISPAFVKQIERLGGRLDKAGTGLLHGAVCGLSLHAVATGEAFRAAPSERLLYTFCRAFLQQPTAILPPLDDEEQRVYLSLYDHVEQFRRKRGSMAMKDEEQAKRSTEALLADILRNMSQDRFDSLMRQVPGKLLPDLGPEARLLALPDDALRALSDDYVRTLSPETQAKIRARINRS